MLQRLGLDGVGPAKRLDVEFGERLNLITGDNGVGKSFLLDIAWWALTRTWAHKQLQALPRDGVRKASIQTTVLGRGRSPVERRIPFDFKKQSWKIQSGRPQIPGLVIYAQVDGSFAVWDPARNYWKEEGESRPSAFRFDSSQVWSGLQEDGQWRCNGLYRDWASWQRENKEPFQQLKRTIAALSPPGETALSPGPLLRISTEDSQDYPSLHMPYGIAVPVVHCSAAIRRMLALAYLLIWSWNEHLLAANQRREKPTHRIIFLIDEMEAHLHPAWQRTILPALFEVVQAMETGTSSPSIQVIAATHSPLVCASAESVFDEERDRLLDLDLDPENGVRVESAPFVRRGTSERWLVSRHFDLKTTYSAKAEEAIREAERLVEEDSQSPGSIQKRDFLKVDGQLRESLPDMDSFWVVWRRIGDRRGWTA